MFKKLFFLFLSILSLSINNTLSAKQYHNNFERWTSVSHLKKGELLSLFNRAVIGDCPAVGYEMALEERKKIIEKLHEQVEERGHFSQSMLKEICIRKASYENSRLCIDYFEPEVVQLLIDLGYSTQDLISDALKKLQGTEISPNALAIFKLVHAKSPLTQEEEQNLFKHIKDNNKDSISSILKDIKKESKTE